MGISDQLWVVGIGASAGGLEALTQFVSALPVDCNACYVVAQHLAPHAKSMMVELVARQSPIPVDVAKSGRRLEPNRLFIVPPNHDVEIRDFELLLSKAGEETRPKPSVDRFFASLADAVGAQAIGVVLSGTGSDGAEGTRAIKMSGGVTFAQEEQSAKYPGMPNSALETGQVEFILGPAEIAKKICEIVKNGRWLERASRIPESEEALDERNPSFESVIALIRKELGNDFSQYKLPTIKRRLAKRFPAVGVSDIASYYKVIKSDPPELRALAQEFLVNVTSFFRDREAFHCAGEKLKEILAKKADGEEVRVWSAGCATGEEAYSLAMQISAICGELQKNFQVKVFATDLDTDSISKARVGFYSTRDVAALPTGYRERYFEERGDHLEVVKSIRDLVIFARQDLIQSPPFVKLDMISCRNVIIYFEAKLQARIFDTFHYALRQGGILFLGKSETVTGATDLFENLDKKARIFVKKPAPPRALPSVVRSPSASIDMGQVRKPVSSRPTQAQIAQAQILERYGIAGAVVDGEGTIQTIVGDASSYLKIQAGLDAFRLQALLPKAAAVELQLLLRKALKTKSLITSRVFKASDDALPGGYFKIKVSPFSERADASLLSPALLLVTFDPIANDVNAPAPVWPQEGDMAVRAAELEQELAATKEHLQTVIEELGVTNEELQSTNEELSSTNEELQSSNEELETTNEEFQSTNEELSTLNEEMNMKSAELRLANSDLENVQISIGLPLLVVDEQLRLQRYNPSASEIFDVGVGDIGRSLSRISCRCEIENFTERVRRVIETGETEEGTVEGYRSAYQMRISPRRGEGRQIYGAVIFFFNNTELIQAEQGLRKSERRIRGIINGTSSLIFLKDVTGKYLTVNQAFLNYFTLEEAKVIGKSDREIFSDSFANQLRNGDLEAILKRTRVERQEEFLSGGRTSRFLVSRFALADEGSVNPYAVGTVAVDITAQIEAQAALKKSEALYRGVVEDQSVFVSRFDPKGNITFVNSAFVRYFGGTLEEYLGQPLSKVIDQSDRANFNEDLKRLNSTRPISQFEHRFSRFENSPRWVRWINKAVLDDRNQVVEIQAVGFDVTEYRQQTDQMVQREMLFSNIFTYTTDFLTVFRVSANSELLLESFNRSVDEGSGAGGYTYAQFLGRNVRDLITSQHKQEILEKYRACVERKETQTFDEELQIQGGTKFLTTTVIPVVSNSGVVERVVTLSRDISKFKIAEAELNAAKAAAEIANETKSDFLAAMSHELRTPLNVVIGMSELLQEADVSPTEREQIKSIHRSGKVLLNLIEDILDISKIEAGKTKLEFNRFSLKELINEVCGIFNPQALSKGIALSAKLPDDNIDSFIGDVGRIRQILINLVGNAIKFTEIGSVRLKVTSVGHQTTGRRLIKFEVKDSGIGIPEDYHSRIFKKFSQVDSGLGRRYGGSGLGLVISQRLTTLMNGQIGFTSSWNKGSTFWVDLPLTIAKKTEKSEKRTRPTSAARRIATAKILAVDDNPDSRVLLEMLLKRLGHKSTMAASGEEAIDQLKKDTFDLVLMDVQMPGLDGYETTARIRKMNHPRHSLPIIALTANAMVGDSEKCFESGMNDYLTKPVNLDLLRGAIEKWAIVAEEKKGETEVEES